MAKLNCKCGYVLNTTQVPNDIELKVYTDKEWEKIIECETIEPWKIPLPQHDVWKCPKCHRIYVFKENNDKVAMIYSLESDQ